MRIKQKCQREESIKDPRSVSRASNFTPSVRNMISAFIILSGNKDPLFSISVAGLTVVWTSTPLNCSSFSFLCLRSDAFLGNDFIYICFLSERFKFPLYTVVECVIRWRIKVLVCFCFCKPNLKKKHYRAFGLSVHTDCCYLYIIPFQILILYREVIKAKGGKRAKELPTLCHWPEVIFSLFLLKFELDTFQALQGTYQMLLCWNQL